MTCASCARRVERAIGNVAGVQSVAVNLATESATVQGSAAAAAVIGAVADGRVRRGGASRRAAGRDDRPPGARG